MGRVLCDILTSRWCSHHFFQILPNFAQTSKAASEYLTPHSKEIKDSHKFKDHETLILRKISIFMVSNFVCVLECYYKVSPKTNGKQRSVKRG